MDRWCSAVFYSIVTNTLICVFLSVRRYLVPATALFCLTLYMCSYYLVSVSVFSPYFFDFQSFGLNFHETSTYSDMKQLSDILLLFSIGHYIIMCFIPARYRFTVCVTRKHTAFALLLFILYLFRVYRLLFFSYFGVIITVNLKNNTNVYEPSIAVNCY